MKSLVREISREGASKLSALKEAETFAYHCTLTKKDAMHVRLLSEELLGMVGGILDVNSGKFWLENDGNKLELHLLAKGAVGDTARDLLLSSSKTGENVAHKGVTGKLRQAMDWMTAEAPMAGAASYMPMSGSELHAGIIISPEQMEWSMKNYIEAEEHAEEKAKSWDELERSVLGKLSDDIVVGVRQRGFFAHL